MASRQEANRDNLLMLASVAVFDNYLDEYETMTEEKEFSISREEMDKRWQAVMRVYRKQEQKRNAKNLPRMIWQKIIAFITALSLLGGGAFVTVMATNPTIREMVLTDHGIVSDLRFILSDEKGIRNTECPEDWTHKYYPAYIPERYTFLQRTDDAIVYIGPDDWLLNFIILDPKSNHGIDTEDMEPYETKVHGYSAILFAKEDDSESAILINFEDCAVFVHGNVTQNEMRDIADNIKIKNWK